MKNAALQKEHVFSVKDLVFPNPSEVDSYLNQHPDLSSILPGLARAARAEFEEPAELSLEVYHDPEIDDHYLTLVVRLPAYDQQTMKRIDAVWGKFEKKIGKSSGWLTLTTDFRLLKVNNGV
jgi:hypothetical protein